jgi:hypothetical protein
MKNFYLFIVGSLTGSDDVLGYLRAEMPSDES